MKYWPIGLRASKRGFKAPLRKKQPSPSRERARVRVI
jgi:hypothetical protein